MAQLHEKNNKSKIKKILDQLIEILKEYNYPLIELADILSIVLMMEYILGDEKLSEIYGDFINSSIDTIDYILTDKTYLKIEDKIIFLEDEFYRNICDNPIEFEEKFINELKKLIINSKNKQYLFNF